MSTQRSRHPRRAWRIFGAVTALALLASLAATIPSGDRTTIVLAVWCWLVGTGVAAAFVDARFHPLPLEARTTLRGAGTSADGGGAYGVVGLGDAGGTGGGDGGSC